MATTDKGDNLNPENGTLREPPRDDSATVTDRAEASRENREGLKTFRSFRAVEQLHATGGEADIYLVERESQKYILKLYRFGMNPKEEILQKTKELSERFARHIVRIVEYGYYEKARRWYEIQEFARFGTLRDLMAEGPAGEEATAVIVSEIAGALRVLHENNILHLDLKPSNILVRSREPLELIFTDFGVSSVIDPEMSKKMTGVKGTPLYWAPESFTGVVGREADYWALGMIALEAATGKHVFAGLDTKVIMFSLSTKPVEVPKSLPERLRTLISGLLSREPKRRWGAGEVARWLGRAEIPHDVVGGDGDIYEAGAAFEEITYKKPYKFKGREFYTIESLTEFFTGRPEIWEDARIHVAKGYVTKWLEGNEDYERSAEAEKIQSPDGDLTLVRFIHGFNPGLDFHYYGVKVDFDSIYSALSARARSAASPAEDRLCSALLSGKLFEYYSEFVRAAGRPEDEPFEFLKLVNSNIQKYPDEASRLEYVSKFLTAVAANENLVIPADALEDFTSFAGFVNDNVGAILTKEEFEKAGAAVPEDVKNDLLHDSKRYSAAYKKFKKLLVREVAPGEIGALTVASGETVRLSGGDYAVRGEIAVESGGDLIVSDARLSFAQGAGITCAGRIKAGGSSFSALAPADGWKNVEICGSGACGSSFSRCVFRNARGRARGEKSVNLKGGAIYIEMVRGDGPPECDAVSLANCVFENCAAYEGGAIFAENSGLTVENCEFNSCAALPDAATVSIVTGYGGALNCAGGKVSIKNARFVSCGANFGGGVHVAGRGAEIVNCAFERCHAKYGGGVFFHRSPAEARSCRFIGCEARSENAKMFESSFFGGGVYAFESTASVAACYFEDCRAGSGGGAIFSEGDTRPAIVKCEYSGCTPDDVSYPEQAKEFRKR